MDRSSYAPELSWSKTLASALLGTAAAAILVGFSLIALVKVNAAGVGLGISSPFFLGWLILSPVLAILCVRFLAGAWSTGRTIVAAALSLLPPPLMLLLLVALLRHGAAV